MIRKNRGLGIFAVVLIVLFIAVTGRNASPVVSGGKHDLSMLGPSVFAASNTEEICVFCHTPHAANTSQSYSTNPNTPGSAGSLGGQYLWNRALPVRAWSMYNSSTMNHDAGGPSDVPGTFSLLCLSCHDGVGAMNVLLNNPSTGAPDQFTSSNQFGDFSLSDVNIGKLNIGDAQCTGDNCGSGGGNLQNDHPVGFVYNPALDTGLKTITAPELVKRMNITGNRVECSTCHDPHMTNPGGNMFLVMSNAGSALCFGCHNK